MRRWVSSEDEEQEAPLLSLAGLFGLCLLETSSLSEWDVRESVCPLRVCGGVCLLEYWSGQVPRILIGGLARGLVWLCNVEVAAWGAIASSLGTMADGSRLVLVGLWSVTLRCEPSLSPISLFCSISSSSSSSAPFWLATSIASSSSLAACPLLDWGWFSLSPPFPLFCSLSSSSSLLLLLPLLLLLVELLLLLSSLSSSKSPWPLPPPEPLPAPPPRSLTPLPLPLRGSPLDSGTRLWEDCCWRRDWVLPREPWWRPLPWDSLLVGERSLDSSSLGERSSADCFCG